MKRSKLVMAAWAKSNGLEHDDEHGHVKGAGAGRALAVTHIAA
jgi:hypothetical protein